RLSFIVSVVPENWIKKDNRNDNESNKYDNNVEDKINQIIA
ncbi:40391_t:CDS:1, partial [Gigaspora margarita]